MDIFVRLLREKDLPSADSIFRQAFGTFIGLADPMMFGGDADIVRTRWLADPTAAFGAEFGGELVASNFATKWGSVGFFGPLTVRPNLWDRGIAKRLLEPTMELFAKWGIRHTGLFTFAQSPKHIGLYQKFGFWPRFLTAIMSKLVQPPRGISHWSSYSGISETDQRRCLSACQMLTNGIYEGLDLEREIRAVHTQGLGDTLLLWDGTRLGGFAICHYGPSTEAGSDVCYVKFGAVQMGSTAGQLFDLLLDACESLSVTKGLTRLVAGVNMARHKAYREMIAYGFRTDIQGVAMQRPNEAGYNRSDVYLIDDWR